MLIQEISIFLAQILNFVAPPFNLKLNHQINDTGKVCNHTIGWKWLLKLCLMGKKH